MFFTLTHTETVKRVLREYHNRITALEDQKFDFEYVVKKKDFEVLEKDTSREIITRRANNEAFTMHTVTIALDVVALE